MIFVRKKRTEGSLTYQGYIEPKGSHLLEQDSWKEQFSLQIENSYITSRIISDQYNIIGFPFFNKENKMEKFEAAVDRWLEKIIT